MKAHREIFGPILPVIGYRDPTEAIAFVNAHPRPLALYPFTHDKAALARVMERTVSGGVGPSGMAAYHGHDGFRRFSHARGVYQAERFSGFNFLAPPYGRKMRIALKVMPSR